jgi:hypothetical protein
MASASLDENNFTFLFYQKAANVEFSVLALAMACHCSCVSSIMVSPYADVNMRRGKPQEYPSLQLEWLRFMTRC